MKNIIPIILSIFLISNCRSNLNPPAERVERTYEVKDSEVKDSDVKDSATLNYEQKITELKSKLSEDFTVTGHSYFVIASNLSDDETEKITSNTIDRAVECFYNDYFEIKPNDITVIFLLKNDETYKYWAKKLYDDDDLSRYGYYKPSEKTMLMNISTGTGTLVHEMTHALVRYDFEDIPSWFNEGLGSLYERCSLNNKQILGYVNWRLPALQDAINDKSYTTLDKLVNMNSNEFYGSRSDVNYAQARYLCLYLQENGLLKKYYKLFRDTYSQDNTGKTQLEKITGKTISELDKDYVSWAKSLKYDP
ncbi:MAG: hypothetical protein L0Y79_12955 [Chlorobi bacterium]|nr:hypothetical protein [Chlorobiota bacterium]MCI0714803.1 hypothetical protein [Chlorobiota bacterium]